MPIQRAVVKRDISTIAQSAAILTTSLFSAMLPNDEALIALDRVNAAIFLALVSPEFLVQR